MTKREKPRALPPLLQDQGKARRHKAHHTLPKKQERGLAEAMGGRVRPGSGAFAGLKGDAERPDRSFPLLGECKRSMGKESIRLKAYDLTKITEEAMAVGAYPALEIQFDQEIMESVARGSQRAPASAEWVAVPRTVFRAMMEALGEEGLGL